jgi:hypothetical protein
VNISNPETRPNVPRRQTWQERRDDPRRGTINVLPRTKDPRPASTPVPETDRNWRTSEYKF